MTESSASRSDITHSTSQGNGTRLRVRRDYVIALIIGLAGFALYAATAAPSVATLFDDSLEFQVVLPTLGIAHPSGYPLYTLLGKLFTLLVPFGDPAGRANLLSALCAGPRWACSICWRRRWSGIEPPRPPQPPSLPCRPPGGRRPPSPRCTRCMGCSSFSSCICCSVGKRPGFRSQGSGDRGQGTGDRGRSARSFQLPASSFRLPVTVGLPLRRSCSGWA